MVYRLSRGVLANLTLALVVTIPKWGTGSPDVSEVATTDIGRHGAVKMHCFVKP